jgi:uncharacterized phage infection (PIP) family protein YhgE
MYNPFKIFKRHNIQLYRVLIIGIIVFCCAIIIAVSSLAYTFSERSYRKNVSNVLNDPYVNLRQQERDYEDNVTNIFNGYKNVKKDDTTIINKLKDELMELKVPSSYREQHFKLIIALDELARGDKESKTSKQVNWLKLNAAWLGKLLNNFIINNI